MNEVVDGGGEAALNLLGFAPLAVVESDRLCVLADADDGEAEVCLALELGEVEGDEAAAEEDCGKGAETRVGDKNNKEARVDCHEDDREVDQVDRRHKNSHKQREGCGSEGGRIL